MNCPKCGYEQEAGTECLRCGIIFVRCHSGTAFHPSKAALASSPARPASGLLRRFYRLFRWLCLAGLIIVLFLMIRPSPPPRIQDYPEAVKSAETKVAEFQSSLEQGSGQKLEMDEPELNGWLQNNLALKRPRGSAAVIPQNTEALMELAKAAAGGRADAHEALEQVQTSVRDVKMELLENSLLVYVLFDFHGMDLSLELEGRPAVRDGYVRLEPFRGKLGSLPLMAGTLQSASARIFDSPGNKEKFRLPPGIQDIRIEQRRLTVIPR